MNNKYKVDFKTDKTIQNDYTKGHRYIKLFA